MVVWHVVKNRHRRLFGRDFGRIARGVVTTASRVLCHYTMATTDPSLPDRSGTDINGIVDERPEIPRSANVVGIDGEGCVHFHSPRERTVWVINPDPDTPIASVCTHEQRVEDIWRWIDHTCDCRGEWAELRYHRGSAFAQIATIVREAADGAE